LSGGYVIRFTVTEFTDADPADDPGKFQIYVDNNTTSSGNSIHGGDSKILEYAVGATELASLPATIEITPDVGTESSFLQIRADSRIGSLVIDDFEIVSTDAPVEPAEPAVLSEEFTAVDSTAFFSATYKAMPSDAAVPLYEATSGGSRISVDGAQLTMANARFTIGSVDNTIATTGDDVSANGELDLSPAYTIRFTVVEFTDADPADDPGKFQLYIDNNTTGSSNSMHGGGSKVLEFAVGATELATLPAVIEISPAVGSATSFIQVRADSRVGSLVIDDLTIDYND